MTRLKVATLRGPSTIECQRIRRSKQLRMGASYILESDMSTWIEIWIQKMNRIGDLQCVGSGTVVGVIVLYESSQKERMLRKWTKEMTGSEVMRLSKLSKTSTTMPVSSSSQLCWEQRKATLYPKSIGRERLYLSK